MKKPNVIRTAIVEDGQSFMRIAIDILRAKQAVITTCVPEVAVAAPKSLINQLVLFIYRLSPRPTSSGGRIWLEGYIQQDVGNAGNEKGGS